MATRIVFTGDISFSKYFESAWKKTDVLSPEIRQYLRDADFAVANVECPLTDRSIRSERVLNHACSPEAGAFLRENGILYWSLANNHIMDCGAEGLADTIRCAEENGCNDIRFAESVDDIIAEDIEHFEHIGIGAQTRRKPHAR